MGAKLPVGLFLLGVAVVLISGVLLWYFRDAPRAAEAAEIGERLESFAVAVVAADHSSACGMLADPAGFASGFGAGVDCSEVISVVAGALSADQADALGALRIGDVTIRETGPGTDRAEARVEGEVIVLVRSRGCEGTECWLIETPEALLRSVGAN